MARWYRPSIATIVITVGLATAHGADTPNSGAGPTVNRYPQTVRAVDLEGRLVLEPKESQPVLGHVVNAVHAANGDTGLVVRLSGWLQLDLFGTRQVVVPIGVMAVLGEHVAAMDIKPDALNALPTFDPASATPIAADEKLQMGIVGPFH